MNKTKKLYCYVDETGQDTQGELFIVSVVVTEEERDELLSLCEEVEKTSGKGKVKWNEARHHKRLNYIRRVLREPAFKRKLNFAIYRDSQDYLPLTVLTIARAIVAREWRTYNVSVLIDGLPRSLRGWVGSELRHFHIQVRKVRGVRKDEANALIRLADAVCGFVRAAKKGQKDYQVLLRKAREKEVINEL